MKQYTLLGVNGFYKSYKKGSFGGNKRLKIYGCLDCPSANRWIEKGYYVKDRVFFKNESTAIACGFRPCGICMKKQYKRWKLNKN